ncbi:METTL5 family protein [Thermogladius sp. 4427co]|uniref:METTL5 family protein n=1 Tax=Thermogladius sp. 4427co TaxID=3450718 RepID=UPI003F7A4C75
MSTRGSLDKKELELLLSALPRFPKPRRELEQYETPPDVAAEILWDAFLSGELTGSIIIEPGCGIGRLVYGSILLGAALGLCLDIDERIVEFAREAHCSLDRRVCDKIIYLVSDFLAEPVVRGGIVLMNPPFGVYKPNRGIDMRFLDKALDIARTVYSIHKYSEKAIDIIREKSFRHGFKIAKINLIDLGIPMVFESHRRRIYRFKAFYVVLKGEQVGNR